MKSNFILITDSLTIGKTLNPMLISKCNVRTKNEFSPFLAPNRIQGLYYKSNDRHANFTAFPLGRGHIWRLIPTLPLACHEQAVILLFGHEWKDMNGSEMLKKLFLPLKMFRRSNLRRLHCLSVKLSIQVGTQFSYSSLQFIFPNDRS